MVTVLHVLVGRGNNSSRKGLSLSRNQKILQVAANSGMFLAPLSSSPYLPCPSVLCYILGCWNLDEKENKVRADSNEKRF